MIQENLRSWPRAVYNDFYQAFALLALQEGLALSYFDSNLDCSTQKQLRDFKKACIDKENQSMAEMPSLLTPQELLNLVNKPNKTPAIPV